MKTISLLALSVLLPMSALASYQYVNTSGQLVTVNNLSEIKDQAPNSGYIFLPTSVATPVQTNSVTSQPFDLDSLSVSELKDLRARINDELDSRVAVTDETTKASNNSVNVSGARATWDDTKDPYYSDGKIYVETKMSISSAVIGKGRQEIPLSLDSKSDGAGGYILYSFNPSSPLSSGSYGLKMLQEGKTVEYDEDTGVIVYDYVIRLNVQ